MLLSIFPLASAFELHAMDILRGDFGLKGGKCCTTICRRLVGDPTVMLELVRLVQVALVAGLRSRRRLVVENLLLRQQLRVALRSQR